MTYQAEVIRILIASPGDMKKEREATVQVLSAWNNSQSYDRKKVLLPVMWETDSAPQMGAHPQKIINEQVVSKCDMAIALFSTRLGTPTDTHLSGTDEEIKRVLGQDKSVSIYFFNKNVRVDQINLEAIKEVRDYKDTLLKKGLYGTYQSIPDYKKDLLKHLTILMDGLVVRWFEDTNFMMIASDPNGKLVIGAETFNNLQLTQFERNVAKYLELHARVDLLELIKLFGKKPIERLKKLGLIGIETRMVGLANLEVSKFVKSF